ncbi:phosphatidylglycerophosphatase A [Alphaproteobacteria bacterium]|nr:phosphatidylglycerophosphatase A [Alphaproteobacteria bacterium]
MQIFNKNNTLFIFAKLAEAYPIGKVKFAPGTLASFFALIIGYYILIKFGVTLYIAFIFIFVILGYILCEAHIKVYKKKDPREVVVDEFAGQFIVILATIDTDDKLHVTLSLLISFSLFRFFDITKLGPIKKMENLKRGLGIMADDILAGIFALVTQSALLTFLNQPIILKSYMS